jgi:ribokinase
MEILVVGSFMMDLVVQTPRVPLTGETVIGDTFAIFPGGKGANQAVAASRLGGSVALAGKLGTDYFGKEMLQALTKENIDLANVRFDERSSTGIGSILLDESGNNRIVVVPGANLLYDVEDVNSLEPVIASSGIVVLQLELAAETVEQTISLAHSHRVPVLLNPAPATSLSDDLLRKITYLTPNETELAVLTGLIVESIAEVEIAARTLLAKGVKHVIVTLAERGAMIVDANGCKHVPGYSVDPVDTVAAGDSFNGALSVQILSGAQLAEAVRYANAVGALTVLKKGAIPSLPFASEVETFISQHD